jgi:3-oxoacid CoA-transferase subunit A
VDKSVASVREALQGVASGATIAVGGFGLCGVPFALIAGLLDLGVSDLELVSNNCGVDGAGLGTLISAGRARRVVGSYVGQNKEAARQYLSGELEVELVPQGTLAERLRAGGAGIPAFYTPVGVGTLVAEGGLPWRHGPDGQVTVASPPREVRHFGGVPCVLETSIVADVALVHAVRGDRDGNLVFAKSARNFNPLCAMAGQLTIAEVEELVEPGEIDPAHVHLPGVFVQRLVRVGPGGKLMEKRTTRPRPAGHGAARTAHKTERA